MADLKETHAVTTTNGSNRGNATPWLIVTVGVLLMATVATFFMTV